MAGLAAAGPIATARAAGEFRLRCAHDFGAHRGKCVASQFLALCARALILWASLSRCASSEPWLCIQETQHPHKSPTLPERAYQVEAFCQCGLDIEPTQYPLFSHRGATQFEATSNIIRGSHVSGRHLLASLDFAVSSLGGLDLHALRALLFARK